MFPVGVLDLQRSGDLDLGGQATNRAGNGTGLGSHYPAAGNRPNSVPHLGRGGYADSLATQENGHYGWESIGMAISFTLM